MQPAVRPAMALLLASALAYAPWACAGPGSDPFGRLKAVGNDVLDKMRGGFVARVGEQPMNVSFGIERAVYVNGELVTSLRMSVQAPGNGALSASASVTGAGAASGATANAASAATQAASAVGAPSSDTTVTQTFVPTAGGGQQVVTLVQNGPGNTAALPSLQQLPTGIATVIQNSLDNQRIQSATVINATVSNTAWLRAMSLSNSISQQLSALRR